jgi:hypothetical protein
MRRRGLLHVVGPILITGCVAVENPGNWQPQDVSTRIIYYECFKEAQQAVASGGFGVGAGAAYGSARASMKTNDDLLCACMASKGYTLRKANTTETVLGVAFAPVWVPVSAIAAIGEGMSGDPPKRWIGCP